MLLEQPRQVHVGVATLLPVQEQQLSEECTHDAMTAQVSERTELLGLIQLEREREGGRRREKEGEGGRRREREGEGGRGREREGKGGRGREKEGEGGREEGRVKSKVAPVSSRLHCIDLTLLLTIISIHFIYMYT